MEIKRIKLYFAPKNKKFKIDDSYSINEVCDFLTRYLNDEFEISDTEKVAPVEYTNLKLRRPRRRRKKKKANQQIVSPFAGLNEVQALMLSNAIIGTRVILKYCKGEKPHWMRAQIWLKGLRIADYLEDTGYLNTKKICFYVFNGYLFCCRVYNIDTIGTVILPETTPCKLSHWLQVPDNGNDPPGPFLDMPPLMPDTGGKLKKEAAKIITEYDLELERE